VTTSRNLRSPSVERGSSDTIFKSMSFGHAADKDGGPCSNVRARTPDETAPHQRFSQAPLRHTILFDEDRAWQFKLPLNFEQILERRFIAQRPAPDCRPGVGAKISPLPAQPIEVGSVLNVPRVVSFGFGKAPMSRQACKSLPCRA